MKNKLHQIGLNCQMIARDGFISTFYPMAPFCIFFALMGDTLVYFTRNRKLSHEEVVKSIATK